MAIEPVTLKRSDLKHFLNTGTSAVPTWSLINLGVTAAAINYNPAVLEEGYIADVAKTKQVESYAPEMPLAFTAKKNDPVYDFCFEKAWSQAVLSDSYTELVTVRTAETPTEGAYPAKKQAVSISSQDIGNEAVTSLKLNVTLLFMGDPIDGTFNPTTKTFTAAG